MRKHSGGSDNGGGEHDVHTDPAALVELTDAAERERAGYEPSGAVVGYRPRRTLRFGVELRRQLSRRRTLLILGLAVVLPFVLLGAFELGDDSEDAEAGGIVDLATASAPNFVIFTLFVSISFLLPMVVALFFGDTIASEASWSSLKYLLAAPTPRHRLLRQKALVAGALSTLTLVLLPATALGVGLIWYGAGDALRPTGDAVPFDASLIALLLAVCYIVIQLTWVAGLALLLSASTDAPLGAVGGAVLAAILSQILDQITALGDLRAVLPTHYATAWLDLIATDVDWTDVATGAFVSLCYATVLGLLAARHFVRKDITS
ncbi:ABC transporter permease subunit [Haloechinothrix sp. LS1_15]|uniref:ABC transporter permease n=1 Tax=Haloechinothrix sp. LS1_15 TaxID=2652248 RepID=UPI002944B89C|nr:ABC transporter permease subunit [Haloechinothrix sp. LS1_15]MDV6012244.1 ABC transporter permease subunit [Haloechinothrix sp. LS1_15]